MLLGDRHDAYSRPLVAPLGVGPERLGACSGCAKQHSPSSAAFSRSAQERGGPTVFFRRLIRHQHARATRRAIEPSSPRRHLGKAQALRKPGAAAASANTLGCLAMSPCKLPFSLSPRSCRPSMIGPAISPPSPKKVFLCLFEALSNSIENSPQSKPTQETNRCRKPQGVFFGSIAGKLRSPFMVRRSSQSMPGILRKNAVPALAPDGGCWEPRRQRRVTRALAVLAFPPDASLCHRLNQTGCFVTQGQTTARTARIRLAKGPTQRGACPFDESFDLVLLPIAASMFLSRSSHYGYRESQPAFSQAAAVVFLFNGVGSYRGRTSPLPTMWPNALAALGFPNDPPRFMARTPSRLSRKHNHPDPHDWPMQAFQPNVTIGPGKRRAASPSSSMSHWPDFAMAPPLRNRSRAEESGGGNLPRRANPRSTPTLCHGHRPEVIRQDQRTSNPWRGLERRRRATVPGAPNNK